MLTIDYIIVAAFLVSVVIGLFRGFFREALSVLTWIAALWITLNYSDVLEPMLGSIASPALKLWAARLLTFVLVLIAGGLLNALIGILVNKTGLSGTDRVLGMVFGGVRGVLLVGILILGFRLMELDQESWWEQSRLVPLGEPVALWLLENFQAGMEQLDEAVAPAIESLTPKIES
ncbi:MAG: CvpA family protein [Gammaproteobacteria bacterium]